MSTRKLQVWTKTEIRDGITYYKGDFFMPIIDQRTASGYYYFTIKLATQWSRDAYVSEINAYHAGFKSLSEANKFRYIGRYFTTGSFNSNNLAYYIESIDIKSDKVKITWGKNNSASYGYRTMISFIEAGTWKLTKTPIKKPIKTAETFPVDGSCFADNDSLTDIAYYLVNQKEGKKFLKKKSVPSANGIAWNERCYWYVSKQSNKYTFTMPYLKALIYKLTKNLKEDDKSNENTNSKRISKPISGGKRENFNVSQLGGRGKGLDPSDRRRRERDLSFESPGRSSGEGLCPEPRRSRSSS